ncbi:MAG: metalloendopeptidase [Nitrospinaceae bacterium]|nr:MAG: metalloendopeptidase [Nitrospinaceae bacterium]
MSTRRLQYTGAYFDGLSARKHEVVLSLSPRQLGVTLPGGRTLDWQYADLRLNSADARGNPPFHLEHVVNTPEGNRLETLSVEDPAFLSDLRAISAVSLHPTLRPASGMKHVFLALAVLAVPIFLYGLWTVVIPKLSDHVAMRVPVSWEEKLGDRILQSLPTILAPSSQPDQEQALNAIARRLLATHPDQPYNIRIYISQLDVINAVAFPGGSILVFQGLLNAAASPEELAGILAHEIQHVTLRHSTRGIIRAMAASTLLTLFTGDMSGTMDVVLNVAGELQGLSFSRDMEREADEKGMDMILAANIDPSGMVRMFEKLQQEEGRLILDAQSQKTGSEDDSESWLEYLSTHPAGKGRVKELKKQVEMSEKKSYTPLLPDIDWKALTHRDMHPKESEEDPSVRQTFF